MTDCSKPKIDNNVLSCCDTDLPHRVEIREFDSNDKIQAPRDIFFFQKEEIKYLRVLDPDKCVRKDL